MQLDTYAPEIERYGGSIGLDLSEQIFHVDSEAVVRFLSTLDGDMGAEPRWRLALRGFDTLIDDFGFSPREKRDVINRGRQAYRLEFNVDSTDLRHLLGSRFRQYRKQLDSLWDPCAGALGDIAPAFDVWTRRSERMLPIANRLRLAERRNELQLPITRLIDSYLHMFVNRIARAHGRLHELVMFEFLARHHEAVDTRTLLSQHKP